MGLPRAVIAANEQADAILAQRAAQNGTPQAAAPEAPAPVVPEAVAPEAPAAPAAPPQTPAFESTWEQRFKVLDGKYRAEVPRLHQQIKDKDASIANLQELVAQAKSAPATRVEFTAEEREQFGDELLNVVARVASAQAPAAQAPQVDLTPINERMQRLERQSAETAEDAFFRKLGEQIPHWEAQNTNAGFLEWLAKADDLTGRVRQDLFNEAYDALDVSRISAFFRAYPYQSPVARSDATQPTLEQQVAPDVNRSAPPPPAGKKVYSRGEIEKFYTDVRRGLYQGRVEDMQRIEQDIFAAQQEGRVR